MPNHIFINRESGNDNISIFYDEPSFVVIANKDDLASIQLIDESKKPVIYILLGDDKRYIRQASNAIFNRLQQHYINKPWWNRLIFFGREDGHLSKAQLDLLERKIIEKMKRAEIELDNNTQGNQSYIDKLSQFSALSLLSKVGKVLIDIANIGATIFGVDRQLAYQLLFLGSKIFGTDDHSLTRLVVGTFLVFWCKNKKGQTSCNQSAQNTLERISQHG